MLQLGRLHPDEVFQYLEPANHRAFGYGVLAWEWQTGLRNWAVPGLLAYVLKLCAALGIDDPWKRRAVLEVPQVALHGWMLWAAWKLAVRRVDEALARWVVPLVGLYMPVLSFAGRTMSESFSAAFLVVGLELMDRPKPDAPSRLGPALWGGAVLGLSVVARYGSAAAVIGAMVFLLARRRFSDFLSAAIGGLVVALALGALDWATWGDWFHSLRAYLDFNVFSGKAAQQFGSEPVTAYLPFVAMLAPWAWLALRTPRAISGVFAAAALTYTLAIFVTAHKEPRFLYPALVLMSVAMAPAALALLSRWGTPAFAAAAVVSLAFFAIDTPLKVQRPEQFRLEAKAWPQATGFYLIPEGMWGSGGYFWLGKNIPWSTCDFAQQLVPAMRDPRLNRIVSWNKQADAEIRAAGFQVLEEQGDATLYGR